MCAIAGLLGGGAASSMLVRAMCNTVRHRGPDDAGFALFQGQRLEPVIFADDDTPVAVRNAGLPFTPTRRWDESPPLDTRLALGHRRLAIAEPLPVNHQPMCSSDERYWVTFDGQIYNYSELREELESLGYRFASRCDTEVVIAAYAQWGADCLHRFNGMWGIGILDRHSRTLFLARDRFGIKPLYYWASGHDFLAFGSEIKQFTVLPGWRAYVNGQRAYDFLVHGISDHSDETMFDQVFQIEPGHCATVSIDDWRKAVLPDGRISQRRWYTLRPANFHGDFAAATGELLSRLTDSVGLCMRSEMPLGSSLSGGLDSSAVVALASRALTESRAERRLQTFSGCADIEAFNERKWVDLVVGACNVDPHYVYPSAEGLMQEAANLTWHQDEPFGSTTIYAQWCVFRLAGAAGVKAMLGGHGSDEQLAGYTGFFGPALAGLARRGLFLRFASEARAMRSLYGYTLADALKWQVSSVLPFSMRRSIKFVLGRRNESPSWLDLQRLRAEVAESPKFASASFGSPLQHTSHFLLDGPSSRVVLHWEDRSAMAHSFESRVPFLDHRLVEFTLGLPDEFKLHHAIGKRVLRAAFRATLPDATVDRTDKMGFPTPEEVWLRQTATGLFRQRLDAAISASQGILTNASRDYVEQVISGARPFSHLPWRMINFGEWMRVFNVSLR